MGRKGYPAEFRRRALDLVAAGEAVAEAWIATFKSELVDGRRFPSFEHVEHETLHWIGFYNEERLHEEPGDLPPTEYEELNINTDNSRKLADRYKSLYETQGASGRADCVELTFRVDIAQEEGRVSGPHCLIGLVMRSG